MADDAGQTSVVEASTARLTFRHQRRAVSDARTPIESAAPMMEPAPTATAEMPAPIASTIGNKVPGPDRNSTTASPIFAPSQKADAAAAIGFRKGSERARKPTSDGRQGQRDARDSDAPAGVEPPAGRRERLYEGRQRFRQASTSTRALFMSLSPGAGARHVDAGAGRRADRSSRNSRRPRCCTPMQFHDIDAGHHQDH